MTQIKVSDLTNDQLDEWVARARGWQMNGRMWLGKGDSAGTLLTQKGAVEDYSPTSNPAQGAELITVFRLDIYPDKYGWVAIKYNGSKRICIMGAMELAIAICRVVVASVYGEYVETPHE